MQTAGVLWLVFAVWFNCIGWGLTLLHQLTTTSYVIASASLLGALFSLRKKYPLGFTLNFFRYQRRFRRLPAAAYLLVATLIFLGGFLYAPTNYDALTYRLPRMLNWLMEGQWFWIPTFNTRMNFSGLAWEWTAMPLLVIFKSDRTLFLINAAGFLLMPGMLFSIFRRMGVAGRVAWNWMWILPLAYGYATQAGSIGNDFTGTIFLICSVYFGLKARRSGRPIDVWLAIWAAALLSGTKLSNLPLGLPCLVAVWPALKALRKNIVGSLAASTVAIAISALPMMALNHYHTGNWSGDPRDEAKVQVKNPTAAFLGNSLLLAEQTLMPPVLPSAGRITEQIRTHLPTSWEELLRQDFPRFHLSKLNELPTEEASGLGLGIALALLTGIGATLLRLPGCQIYLARYRRLSPISIAAGVATLFYMSKMGSESTARLLLPYYPLLVAGLLQLPTHQYLLRKRSGRVILTLFGLCILPGIILSAARPLWPAQTISRQLLTHDHNSPGWQRMMSVYNTYATRNDALGPVRDQLPSTVRAIGLIAGVNNATYALWRPFGQRKVIELRPQIEKFLTHPGDIEWVIIKDKEWADISPIPVSTWAQAHHATVVATVSAVELVAWGPETWTIIRFNKD